MNVKIFCDTNVFVYAALQSPGCEEKRSVAIAVLTGASPIVASTQVLNEFTAVLLRNRFSGADVQQRVESIIADCSVTLVTVDTIRLAWEVKKRYLLLGQSDRGRRPACWLSDPLYRRLKRTVC